MDPIFRYLLAFASAIMAAVKSRNVSESDHVFEAVSDMRVLIALVVVAFTAAAAHAEVVAPPGWSLSQSDRGIVVHSPCAPVKGFVAYAIYPASRVEDLSLSEWLKSRDQSLLSAWSGTAQPTPPNLNIHVEGDVAIETTNFVNADGSAMTAVFIAHVIGDQGQHYAIVAPSDTIDEEATSTALDSILNLIGERFTLSTAPTEGTQRPESDTQGPPGSVDKILGVSDLRYLLAGRITPGTHNIFLAADGRFYVDRVSEYAIQGRWMETPSGYTLDYGDGSHDLMPASCVHSNPAEVSNDSPAEPSGQTCRTVTSTTTEVRTMMVCDPNRGCSAQPVATQVTQDKWVCD